MHVQFTETTHKVVGECLSVRQLILQHRPRAQLAFVKYKCIMYVAIVRHAQECNYQLRLQWYILVPVWNMTPLNCTDLWYAV